MLSCPTKLSTSRLPLNSMPRTVMSHFTYVNEHTTSSTCGASLMKYISPCIRLSLSSSFDGPYSSRAVHKGVLESCKGQAKSDLLQEQPSLSEKIQIISSQYILESVDSEEDKEIQRRRKIAHGNKGRRPWNKGLKHSEETREIISRRTKEALRDPKVRKKMSEAPRTLSNRTKARISSSLTKRWGQRLKWKRSREKFMQSWADSIAKAAKRGANNQQELDWDSYEKRKQEIALQQIRLAEEKEKVKEMKRIQAERAAQAKAEKIAMLAQKRREQELRGESVRKRNKKSKEEKEKLAESQELKLKERLMKIHKKKSAINQVSNQHQRSWEKLDLDFAKAEQLQKEVSLADQIHFAKKRREEQLLDKR